MARFVCGLVLFGLLLALPGLGLAKVWTVRQGGTVGKDCDATEVKDLPAQVQNNDEVWVYPGVYAPFRCERVGLWKAVDAQGKDVVPRAGVTSPVVVDAKGGVIGISLFAGATLQGFEVTGAIGSGWAQGSGIWVYTGNATVQDCLLHDNQNAGIFVSNGAAGNMICRCMLVGDSIIETGMQGVKNNRYNDNTLYDGRILISDQNNGAQGKGNRCFTGPPEAALLNEAYQPRVLPDYFPSYGKLRVTIDCRKAVIGSQPEAAVLTVLDAAGKTLATGVIARFTEPEVQGSKKSEELTTYTGLGRVTLALGELPDGVYRVVAKLQGKGLAQDTFTAEFTRRKLPWEKTTLGISDKVLPPWTPLVVGKTEKHIACWGRNYTFADSGLPWQIETAGMKLLTAPITLEGQAGDGTDLHFAADTPLAFANITKAKATVRGHLQGRGVMAMVTSEMEYDGFLKVTLRVETTAAQQLKNFRLVIPVSSAYATHLHAAGPDMRSSVWAGRLPATPGKVWDSTMSRGKVDPTARMTVGSFKPFIWLGYAGKGGLAYMADNDRGWVPSDNTPAFEVVRVDEVTTNFVFNLISDPFSLHGPRTIVFALQATPVKPLPADMHDILTGIGNTYSFTGADWDGTWTAARGSADRVNAPFPIDWEKNRAYVEELAKEGNLHLPYQTLNYTHLYAPVDPRTNGPEGWDFWKLMHSEIECDGCGGWCMTPAHMEYRLYRYAQWVRDSRIRGLYFDNAYPILCRKVETGCGYVLDDGRIQPGFTMFGMREFFKRLRTIIVEEGLEPCIFTHSTDTFMAPAYSFIDIMMDGENWPIGPEEKRYFSEIWSPEHFQALCCPHQWGIMTVNMAGASGDWSKVDPAWTAAQTNSNIGYLLLHDAECYYSKWVSGTLIGAGMDTKRAVTFLPYWDEAVQRQFSSPTPNLLIGGYRQDIKWLVVVFNHSRTPTTAAPVTLRLKEMGITTDGPLTIDGKPYQPQDGAVTVPVDIKAENYIALKVSL